jgi:hypothetical protein
MSNKNCGPDLVKYIVVQPSVDVITGATGNFDVCNGTLFAQIISGCTSEVNLNGNIFYNDGPVSFGSSVSACTGIYTSNIYGCSPITVHDDLILLTGLTLNTIINDDSLAQVLVRDSGTGLVKYRDAASLISATDKHVTGTTFVNDLVLLTRNDGEVVFKLSGGTNTTLSNPEPNLIKIDLNIPSTINTFVTGFTYDDINTFTIGRNDGVNLTTTINTLSGVTYYGDGKGIYNIPISGVTNLQTELDNKLDVTNFNTYTANTQIILDGKIDSVNNVGGANEFFKDKSGTTLNFRTISGGSNTTISTIGDIVKVDVTIPSDTNTFVTGGTYNNSTDTITLSRNDGGTIDITGVTDTFTTGATYDNGTALATFTRNDGNSYTLDLSTIDVNDTFVTGFTYNDTNTFTISRNDGVNLSASINSVTGFTVNGDLLVTDNTVLSGLTIVYGDTPTSSAIQPGLNNTYDLGAPSFRWREIFTTNLDAINVITTFSLFATNNVTVDNDLVVSGNTRLIGSSDYESIVTGTNPKEIVNVEYLTAYTQNNDTFVTGTTFTPNQVLLTRNDGFDVLKLSGGSNVTLSNPSTNQIKIDVNIPAGVNTFVTGGTYNDLTNTITLSRNDGGTIDITGVTDSYVTGATLNGNNLELGRNEGLATLSVDLSSIDTNYYVTGATFTNNLLTLERSGGLSNINVNIDNFTGLTVNGSISATTYYGDGSNLTGISTVDNYTTGATLNGSTLIFNRTDALSAYTVSLAGLVTTGGTETKELFFGDEEFTINNAGRSFLTTTSTGFLSFVGVGQSDDAGVSFRIPLDYNSEPEFSVQWTMDGTSSTANTVNYNLNITTGRTTTINEHTVIDETVSIVDEAYSGTAWRILQTPYSSSTITYNPGDYIHVELERDPSDGNDNMTDTAYVSGLIFRYKANK